MPNFITQDCKGCQLCTRICPVKAIQGTRKQRCIIDPRLCIECDACGRICTFSAVVDARGQTIPLIQPAAWSKPTWDYPTCTACVICVQACPAGAVGLRHPAGKDGRTAYPYLKDSKRCLGCAFCANACPLGVIRMDGQNSPNKTM
jgi:ferredoxin